MVPSRAEYDFCNICDPVAHQTPNIQGLLTHIEYLDLLMKIESVDGPELFEGVTEEICPIYDQSYGIFSEADSLEVALLVEPSLLFFY